MARPIEFDQPKALNRALVLFWRKGYQATSLADLLAAMDIGRSSFYAAFTDKRSLFIECLDLFSARTLELLQRARAEMPPLDALQDFFERNLTGARGAGAVRGHWGCMLVNTVLEMADVDDELAARASHHLNEMQRIFQACLKDAGAVPARAEELAAMLMLFNEGIRVSSRRRLPDAQHLQPIATTFRLIRSEMLRHEQAEVAGP
jgi:TetR/AcrR family transcriptional regulator, transcriptional repressor for nem operon